MDRATVERLNAINLEFYRCHADAFSRTRSRPWKGWRRALDALPPARRLSVLDVGCGNGRLAVDLAERFERVDYLGLDASDALLEVAGRRLDALSGVHAELSAIDLVRERLAERLRGRRFGLVAAFGLFHHLPGGALRLEVLSDLAALTEPGGVCALGFWQFGAHERFRRRFVAWRSFNSRAGEPIDLDQVEPGDHLLAWGEGDDVVRYCHWTTPDEARVLFAEAGLAAADLYFADGADGKLNLYATLAGGTGRAAG